MLIKIRLLLIFVILAVMFSACISERKANPPRNKGTQERDIQPQRKEEALLDVPIIHQKPELDSGCEVTSLAMLLQYAGADVDKMTLAQRIKKDTTPLVLDDKGDIKSWGNPEDGFVGDITGERKGLSVYPGPVMELMEQYIPGRGVNLTGRPADALIESVGMGKPVIVWVTIDFKLPDRYEEWEKDGKKIRATFDEHAVVLVGYDNKYFYVNDPYSGVKNKEIGREGFIKVWNAMGSMALSYK